MRLLIGLLLCSVVWAQTLTPSTINFTGRVNWMVPDAFPSTVGSCGTLSVGSWSGGSATLNAAIHPNVVGQTIYILLDEADTYALAAGSYSSTATVTFSGACSGTQTLTVNYTAATRSQASFLYPGGSCVGCTTPGTPPPWQDPVTAMPTPMNPGNATLVVPPTCPGGTWTDPVLGGKITCVSPAGLNQSISCDSTNSCINADDTIVALEQLDGVNQGSIYLTKTDGSGTQCKMPAPSNLSAMWDPKDPTKFYIFSGLNVLSYTFAFGGCTFTGPTTVYTYGGSGTVLTNSGDGMVNLNGDLAFVVSGGDTVAGTVNVYTGVAKTHNYASDPWFAAPRGAVYTSVNYSEATNKLYIHLDQNTPGTSGSNEILNLSLAGTLTVEGPEARIPESIYANGGTPFLAYQPSTTADCNSYGGCQSTQHACVFETRVNGKMHEFYYQGIGPVSNAQLVATPIDLDGGVANGMRITEDSGVGNGGGAGRGTSYGSFPINATGSGTHYSCAQRAAVAIVSVEGFGVTTYQITNVAVGATTTVTVGSTTGLANTNVVIIGGVQGVTGMPSTGVLCTVASLTATTWVCNGLTTSGTYTANTGSAILNVARTADGHLNEIVVQDFTNINAPVVHRNWHHNSLTMSDRLSAGSYWSQAHGAISMDGTLACAATNWGIPENIFTICGSTGYPTKTTVAPVNIMAVAVR